MNPPRMLWHLVRFHFLNMPLLLCGVLLLYCAFIIGLQWSMSDAVMIGGDSGLASQFIVFMLAAQASWGFSPQKGATQPTQSWGADTRDFLWTRAVDRGPVYWAKLIVFAFFCSMLWVNTAAVPLFQSKPLKVVLWHSAPDDAFKARALETPALGPKIVEPKKPGDNQTLLLEHGRTAIAGLLAIKVALSSLLILWCVVTFRSRRGWFVGMLCILIVVFAMFPALSLIFRRAGWLMSLGEAREQLLAYANHAPLIWSAVLAFAAVVIWDTRRRYVRLS